MNEDRETKFIYMGAPQPNRLNGDGPDYSRWGKLLQLAAEKAYGKETAERWSLPEAAAKREEVFSESDPVATVFRVTDSAVKLETINDSGDIVDTYTKAVNAKPKKDCSRCPKFEKCREKVKALKLSEIITAAKCDREGRVIEELPALITDELRLVFGQTGVGQYNGSHWMREIAEVEILN